METYTGYFYSTYFGRDYCCGELSINFDPYCMISHKLKGFVRYLGTYNKNKVIKFEHEIYPNDSKFSFNSDQGIFTINIKKIDIGKITGTYSTSVPHDVGNFQIVTMYEKLDDEYIYETNLLDVYSGSWYSKVNGKEFCCGELSFEYNINSKGSYISKGFIKFNGEYKRGEIIHFQNNIDNMNNNLQIKFGSSTMRLSITKSEATAKKLNGSYILDFPSDKGVFQVVTLGNSLDDEFKFSSCVIL
jgi:hypothetical protein